MADEARPLPPLGDDARSWLDGKWRSRRRGKLPPPWIVVEQFEDRTDADVIAALFALHPVRASEAAEHEEPWLIRGVIRVAGAGPPVLTRLAVEHFSEPSVEVTGHVLHRLPVARIREEARVWLRAKEVTFAVLGERWGITPEQQEWARRVTSEATKLPLNRGRKGYPNEHYRRIALRAVELFRDGRRDVTAALAKEEGRPYATVRDWIGRARKFGFLEQGRQGRTDFRPGPNLYPKGDDNG